MNDNTNDTADISNILESCLNDNLTAKFLISYDDKVGANVDEQFNCFLWKEEKEIDILGRFIWPILIMQNMTTLSVCRV